MQGLYCKSKTTYLNRVDISYDRRIGIVTVICGNLFPTNPVKYGYFNEGGSFISFIRIFTAAYLLKF